MWQLVNMLVHLLICIISNAVLC